MSHVHDTITLLEQELEVTQGRCAQLTRAIDTLRPLAGDDDVPARGAGAGKTKAANRGTNERTNERSKAHASSAEPP